MSTVPMSPMVFDALSFVRNLVNSGMPQAQAEALAQEQLRVLQHQFDQLVTKPDIQLLKVDIQRIEGKLETFSDRLDNLEDKFDKLDTRLDKLEDKFDKLDTRLDKLEGRLGNFERRLDSLESNFKHLEEKLLLRLTIMVGGSAATMTAILLAGMRYLIH